MSATIHGLNTLTFAIPEAEMGLVVQRISASRRGDIKEVRDHDGEYVAVAAGYGKKIDVSINGYKTGSGVSAALGAALTLANDLDGNGIEPSVYVLIEVSDELNNQDFVQQNVRASGYDFS